MKNITALTVLVIIACTFAANNSAFCGEHEKERNYYFSIGPQLGFVHGQSMEIVYPVNTRYKYLSELKWDMKPLFYYGAQVDFGRIDPMKAIGFFSSLAFKAGIPGDTGIMEDRDWQSVENTALTNFSSHTNKTREFYWLDITAGISLPVKSLFYIKPFLSGSWMSFSFTARDGYAKYARVKTVNPMTGIAETFFPIDDNPNEFTVKGDGIRYTQDWLIIAAGFALGKKIHGNFSFDLSFQISPVIFCADKDEHLKTRETFVDYPRWGLFLEPAGRLSFTAQRFELSLEIAHRYIVNTRGETYIKRGNGDYYLAEGEAGTGLSVTDSRFLAKVRL